jgi:hypothetical protein
MAAESGMGLEMGKQVRRPAIDHLLERDQLLLKGGAEWLGADRVEDRAR